jgi:hypothetical protein
MVFVDVAFEKMMQKRIDIAVEGTKERTFRSKLLPLQSAFFVFKTKDGLLPVERGEHRALSWFSSNLLGFSHG